MQWLFAGARFKLHYSDAWVSWRATACNSVQWRQAQRRLANLGRVIPTHIPVFGRKASAIAWNDSSSGTDCYARAFPSSR